MKTIALVLIVLLSGCSAASFLHNDGKNVTLVRVDSGARAVVSGDSIELDATGR
ncbi:hypothetical protein ACI09J_001755 [Cronobacter turicensis]